MSDYEQLSAEECVRRITSGKGSTVFFRVPDDFVLQFGFTADELLGELRSGRLLAQGEPVDGGYRDPVVSFDSLIAWTRHPETPPALIERMLATINAPKN